MNVEQSLIGTMIKENYLIKDTILEPHHFEDDRHKQLFLTMKKLNSEDKSVDVITLSTLSNLSDLGGVSYINSCVYLANTDKFEGYEEIVMESWKERETKTVLNNALLANWSISEIVKKLDDLNISRIDDLSSIDELLAKLFEAPFIKKDVVPGVRIGIKAFDDLTTGFQDSDFIVIGARPSMGKTDFMLKCAKEAGWQGYLPAIFSLEMSATTLINRVIASTGGYNRKKMKNPYGELTEAQKNIWTSVIGKVSQTNIQVFDSPGQKVSEMRAKLRKLQSEYPDKKLFVLIDYLTLIRSEKHYNANTHQQVTEISRDLKAMAKEFNCPVLSLAQLSRNIEQRASKIPVMSDLRESGSIEQDADVIAFLYREKYYDKTSNDNTMQIIIAKQREGGIGNVRANYNEFTGSITDVD